MEMRWVRSLLAATLFSLGAHALLAQGTTGKLEGTVLDGSNQPVNGAQVLVVGTSFGTVTDAKGYYFINNVPAGVYSVRAQYIGMQPAESQNIRMLAGQTITVKFTLTNAVQIGGIQVVAEATPLVPRDQVTSKPIVTGETIDQLPTDDIRKVLTLQPGVVESGRTAGLSLRGGRAGEAAVYVDGVPVRSVRTGGSRLDVGTNAVEEASITTGALGAEFGDAQSGVISFVTRAGSARYQGSFTAQTDEPFGNKLSAGFNRAEGSIGGPIFGNLTFFLAGTLEAQQSDFLGIGADTVPYFYSGATDTTVTMNGQPVAIPQFIQYNGTCDPSQNFGSSCNGRQRPFNWHTNGTANAKLQYTYGGGSRLSLSALADQEQQRDYPLVSRYVGLFNEAAGNGVRNNSKALIANWVQQFIKAPDRALSLDASLSYQTDAGMTGVLDPGYEASHREPSLGLSLSPMDFLTNFNHFSDDTGPGAVTSLNSQAAWNQLVQNVRTNTGTRTPYLNDNSKLFAQPYRMNAWGVATGFPTQGIDRRATLSQERRLYGRLNADLQFDRYNRFKFGGEAERSRVNYFSSSTVSQIFMNAYSEAPVRYGLYGEDRLDLGDVVVVLGLRYDAFDTRSLFPVLPGYTFNSPAYSASDPLNSNVWRPANAHHALSPRVQVSFPVTETTNFRLSYAHQVQTPDFNSMLNGSNNDLSFTNTNDLFGGDVNFGKTIMFEFGIRHAFSQDMVLDIAAYNKDKVSDLAYRLQAIDDPKRHVPVLVQVLTNGDYGNVRGVDANLIRRISNIFTGQISYTFQIARGTGSDPFSYINTLAREIIQVTGDRAPPAQALLPTDDNRTHNIAGSLAFNFPSGFKKGTIAGKILSNAGIFATFRFASGLPYTRLQNFGNGQTAPQLDFGLAATREGELNGASMPWIKNFDLRLNKGLRFGRLDATVFADFRNLFNFRNVVELFAETGDVTNAKYRDEGFVGPELTQLRADASSSGRLIQVSKNGKTIDAADLRGDCNGWQASGSSNPVDCVLLRRAETRWGNNDKVFDVDEQTRAFTARYDLVEGEATKLGAPLSIRLGLELNF